MKLATLVLCTAAAFGQLPPKQDATIALAYTPTPQSVRQMTTILKTLAHVLDVSFDATHSSFTLRGPANSLDLSEWLLHAMDKPAGWQPTMQESDNPSSREYHLKDGGYYSIDDKTPVARVYYLKNTTTPGGVQEILTTLRVVGNIFEVFSYDGLRMLAFRGTATGVDLEEWMIRKLDVTAASEGNPDENVFKLSAEDLVRVFYLDPATSVKDLFDITMKIRTTPKVKVFQKTSPPTITVRGNSALLAQAAQIIETSPNR